MIPKNDYCTSKDRDDLHYLLQINVYTECTENLIIYGFKNAVKTAKNRFPEFTEIEKCLSSLGSYIDNNMKICIKNMSTFRLFFIKNNKTVEYKNVKKMSIINLLKENIQSQNYINVERELLRNKIITHDDTIILLIYA